MWIGKPGDPIRDPAAADRLCGCQRRRRIRHRVQQCDDADAGAAGADRTIVRHRLGHRLCRRHRRADPGARLPRRQLRRPAARCSDLRRCSGSIPSAIEGDRITGPLTAVWFMIFVLPMFLLTPDYPRQASGTRGVARGPARTEADARRIAEAKIDGDLPARQHDLHRRAGVAVRLRRHLCRQHVRLAHHPDRHVRHSACDCRHVRRLARRQARRHLWAEARDRRQHDGAAARP